MKRLLIALFAVPAILIGLLAMHVVTTASVSETAPAHSMSDSMPSPADHCEGSCAPSHEILGMICVLALLAAMVVLTVRPIRLRWDETARFIVNCGVRAVSLAPAHPPSLHLLSISRT